MKKAFGDAIAFCLAPALSFAQGTPGAHFVENWDLDGDGSVSTQEIEERRGDIFYMFDADENDALNAEEYVLFEETRAEDMRQNAGGHAGGGGRLLEGLTMSFNDTDGDGQVTKDEFVDHSAAWFAMIDSNADGVVTTDDFGPQSN